MKRIKLLLLIGGLICLGGLNAQTTVNLRLDTNSLVGLQDTSYIGEVDSLNITIYNDSSVAYLGKITIGSNINGHVSLLNDTIGNAVYYTNYGILDSVPAHGSVSRTLVITVNNSAFIVGVSGVVIWPIAQTNPGTVHISDSLGKTITVLAYPLGINQIDNKRLSVFLSGQQLFIQEEDEYLLKSVKLYDVTGALLTEKKISTSGFVDMAPYAAGIYLAEVCYADNTRRVIKVFNHR